MDLKVAVGTADTLVEIQMAQLVEQAELHPSSDQLVDTNRSPSHILLGTDLRELLLPCP